MSDEQTFTRDQLAYAIQSIMGKHIPDDNEESWPVKAAYAIADGVIDGSVYTHAARLKHIKWLGRPALEEKVSPGFGVVTLIEGGN